MDAYDSLFILLFVYSTGNTLEHVSKLFNIPSSTVESTIQRTRIDLNTVLKNKFYEIPEKFVIQNDDPRLRKIGLIVDSTSFEINKPTGRFEEARIYFDKKNAIYALKKEVAVLGRPPYIAVFFGKGEVGSIHDFAIFKKNIGKYEEYLKVEEGNYFTLLADKGDLYKLVIIKFNIIFKLGYIGENIVTKFPRLTPDKNNNVDYDEENNIVLSKLKNY